MSLCLCVSVVCGPWLSSAVANQLLECRDGSQFGLARLRVHPHQSLRRDRSALTPRHGQPENIGWADLELALPAARVGVALVESLAPRAAHLEHESTLLDIEEIDFLAAVRTTGRLHKTGREVDAGHTEN